MKVLILGGYGVFGGHLARFLIARGDDVIIAGRTQSRAESFVIEHGGTALVLDRAASNFVAQVVAVAPDVIVDAAGPFQSYTQSPVIDAALAARAHYLDLCDDADFTVAVRAYDKQAKQAGIAIISGVSSVPAISAAAVRVLSAGMGAPDVIDTAICPGNRAPRGRSVMAAILRQIGEPIRVWRGDEWTTLHGWSGTRRVPFDTFTRPAAVIGTPDLRLFPDYFDAKSVLFRAGLELGVMHHALRVLGRLRAWRLCPRLDHLTGPLHVAAQLLEPFGSDQGGMSVRVSGRLNGAPVTRQWTCVAKDGVGPQIPAIPALCLVERLAERTIEPGARPALSDLTLDHIAAKMHAIGITTDTQDLPAPRLFEAALPDRWAQMPASWRAAHDVWDVQVFNGEARVDRGTSTLSRIIATVFRFPKASEQVALRVTMERHSGRETWTRDFGGSVFRSTLSPAGDAMLRERFGPFQFTLRLTGDATVMGMEVVRAHLLGVPLPRWACPTCVVREYDDAGRFAFDVDLAHPLAGRLVRYRGWLAKPATQR